MTAVAAGSVYRYITGQGSDAHTTKGESSAIRIPAPASFAGFTMAAVYPRAPAREPATGSVTLCSRSPPTRKNAAIATTAIRWLPPVARDTVPNTIGPRIEDDFPQNA